MVINRSARSIPRHAKTLWRRFCVQLQRLLVAACACLLLACASQAPVPQAPPDAARGERHTVALLGATGMVGDFLLQEALARGHEVRALARNPAKLAHYGSRITVIEGDARDPAVVSALLDGADVVVSALGPVKADGAAARTVNLDATRSVVQAMQQHGIARYVVVSGAAIVMPGDERDLLGWWIRTLAQIGLPDAVNDKQAEYEFLAQSSVEWTLVRCPLIDPEPFRQGALVSLRTPPAFRVRAGELAHFVLDQVDARQFVRQGPFVGSRQAQVEIVASSH
jgi:putative NADH-flavin reductase